MLYFLNGILMSWVFTLSFAAEVDRSYCPQINNKTQSENQHRNSLRPESMISPSELFSFPETETGAVVTRVSLEGTANKANKHSSCNASKDGTRTISWF